MGRRRELTDVAVGLAGRFAGRYNDVDGYWAVGLLCLEIGDAEDDTVVIDLVPPEENVASRLQTHLQTEFRAELSRHLSVRSMSQDWVVAARISTHFYDRHSNDASPHWPVWADNLRGVPTYRFTVTVSFASELGREFAGSASGWCWSHDETREARSITRTVC
jgi:hypothetical protein